MTERHWSIDILRDKSSCLEDFGTVYYGSNMEKMCDVLSDYITEADKRYYIVGKTILTGTCEFRLNHMNDILRVESWEDDNGFGESEND